MAAVNADLAGPEIDNLIAPVWFQQRRIILAGSPPAPQVLTLAY
jgi:hypothetical protein